MVRPPVKGNEMIEYRAKGGNLQYKPELGEDITEDDFEPARVRGNRGRGETREVQMRGLAKGVRPGRAGRSYRLIFFPRPLRALGRAIQPQPVYYEWGFLKGYRGH